MKRPQLQQKPRSRPVPTSSSPDKLPNERKPPPTAPAAGLSIDNWIHDDEEEDPFAAEYLRRKEEERLQRKKESRKRKKKNNDSRDADWDAIYDPERPVRLTDYKGSEEEVRAEHDWKQRLHAHQIKARLRERRSESARQSSVEPPTRRMYHPRYRPTNTSNSRLALFAPPTSYNFAPPASFDTPTVRPSPLSRPADDDEDDYEPPPPAPVISHDQTGEDAYATRMRLAGMQSTSQPPALVPSPLPHFAPSLDTTAPPPQLPSMPQPMQIPGLVSFQHQFSPAPPGLSAPGLATSLPRLAKAPNTISREPVRYDQSTPAPQTDAGTISREPVRYERQTQANPEDDLEESERHGGLGSSNAPNPDDILEEEDEPLDDEPRSNRPGQKGFAKRLMAKYGWKEGQGLGADNSGITTILRHQTQKRKKKPDAEGGGWVQSAAMGRIVGGKRQKLDGEENDEQKFSLVAKFEGIIDGLDLDYEIQEGDLMQRLGERMAEYGHVERLFIDRTKLGREPVFVKFTSALSAFRVCCCVMLGLRDILLMITFSRLSRQVTNQTFWETGGWFARPFSMRINSRRAFMSERLRLPSMELSRYAGLEVFVALYCDSC